MPSHCSERTIALPRGWTKRVESALIQSVSLAATTLTLATPDWDQRWLRYRLRLLKDAWVLSSSATRGAP